MMNLRKKAGNNKGFSLVELIIVIAILAILVGILAPQYIKYVEKSRKATDAANMDSFVSAVKVAAADTSYATPLNGKSYVITMSKSGTAVTLGTGGTGTGAVTDLDKAFDEAVGNKWKQTTLKSNGWTNGPAATATIVTEISATVAIAADGGFTVTYAPDSLVEFLK